MKKLRKFAKETDSLLEQHVASYAIEEAGNYDEVGSWFSDLFQHGCISGMVGGMIYYADTHKFFDEYYSEIEELREQYEEDFGEPLQVKGDLKNWYAWFAFEETARKIAQEVGIEA